ncbi:hypothetical protein [Dyadobacter sp. 32]|uniref:hypothetical protein n=1 Tax=Dyadobacter sp. 32 TaxID=538966 RepID=UPI0011EEAE2C
MKTSINYIIVASDMVWQWYYDEHGTKNFRELLGREAMQFIEITHTNPLKSAGRISANLPEIKNIFPADQR